MKLKYLAILPLALIISACVSQEHADNSAEQAVRNMLSDLDAQRAKGVDVRAFHYSCEGIDPIVVSYRQPADTLQAIVTLEKGHGEQMTLPSIRSASGERYSNGTYEWATKNPKEGLLIIQDKISRCKLDKTS